MTYNHVLRSIDDALAAEAQFDYQENVSGDLLPVQAFRHRNRGPILSRIAAVGQRVKRVTSSLKADV
jgi:hypothetical protein